MERVQQVVTVPRGTGFVGGEVHFGKIPCELIEWVLVGLFS